MEPKVMELWFRWFVFFQFGDFGDFETALHFPGKITHLAGWLKQISKGGKVFLVSFEEMDSCNGINVAGFYIVGTHNFSRIFRGFFVPIDWRFKTFHGIHGCLGPKGFFAVFLPLTKTHGSFCNLRCQSVDDFRKSCRLFYY